MVSHYTMIATSMINNASFEDMLAEEANYTPSHQPRHVKFANMVEGGFTSTPQNPQEEVALPPRPMLQDHPEDIGLHMAACEFRELREPKTSKLKGGYTSSTRLVFQSWLKDICVCSCGRQKTYSKRGNTAGEGLHHGTCPR